MSNRMFVVTTEELSSRMEAAGEAPVKCKYVISLETDDDPGKLVEGYIQDINIPDVDYVVKVVEVLRIFSCVQYGSGAQIGRIS